MNRVSRFCIISCDLSVGRMSETFCLQAAGGDTSKPKTKTVAIDLSVEEKLPLVFNVDNFIRAEVSFTVNFYLLFKFLVKLLKSENQCIF